MTMIKLYSLQSVLISLVLPSSVISEYCGGDWTVQIRQWDSLWYCHRRTINVVFFVLTMEHQGYIRTSPRLAEPRQTLIIDKHSTLLLSVAFIIIYYRDEVIAHLNSLQATSFNAWPSGTFTHVVHFCQSQFHFNKTDLYKLSPYLDWLSTPAIDRFDLVTRILFCSLPFKSWCQHAHGRFKSSYAIFGCRNYSRDCGTRFNCL